VHAIDVDVTDPALAARVSAFIAERVQLPRRGRADSSKFLHSLRILPTVGNLPDSYGKRVMRLRDGNAIEFLARGQQCLVAGTHPSGARYEWRGGLPDCIPTLAAADFETLWSALGEEFAVEKQPRARSGSRAPKQTAAPHQLTLDDLTEMLLFVPGSPERSAWLRVLWALRSAWRDSLGGELDEGDVLELADAYSHRGDTGNYQGIEDVQARFEQGDEHADSGGITWRTLEWLARQGGWRPTIWQRERLENAGRLARMSNIAIGELYGIE
jgi:hypothetical protein